jgi:hypothetical protein
MNRALRSVTLKPSEWLILWNKNVQKMKIMHDVNSNNTERYAVWLYMSEKVKDTYQRKKTR